jgi:hypothetical protein
MQPQLQSNYVLHGDVRVETVCIVNPHGSQLATALRYTTPVAHRLHLTSPTTVTPTAFKGTIDTASLPMGPTATASLLPLRTPPTSCSQPICKFP